MHPSSMPNHDPLVTPHMRAVQGLGLRISLVFDGGIAVSMMMVVSLLLANLFELLRVALRALPARTRAWQLTYALVITAALGLVS